METKTIKINTVDGFIDIEALCVFSKWAIHKTYPALENDTWTLTHIPSKCSLLEHIEPQYLTNCISILEKKFGDVFKLDSQEKIINHEKAPELEKEIKKMKKESLSLFEKLQEESEQSTTEEPKEENSELTNFLTQLKGMGQAEEPQEKEDSELPAFLDQLKSVGRDKEINPPNPENHQATQENKEVPKDEKQECPGCGKKFKQLTRHKCSAFEKANTQIKNEDFSIQESDRKFELEKANTKIDDNETLNKTVDNESASESSGFFLLLDCLPEKFNKNTKIIPFYEIINSLCEAVARENQAPYWNTIEYNPGPGLLARKLEKYLTSTLFDFNNHYILVDTRTAEYRAVAEVLKKHATAIIQGVR